MTNSSTPSSPLPAIGGALILACAAWLQFGHGADPVAYLLLAALGAVLWRMSAHPHRETDPRMARLQEIIEEVANGKVTGRLTHIGTKDDIGQLCWHINNMLDQLESCFREQQTVLRVASTGAFYRKAQPVGLHGVFREALDGSNQSLSVMETAAGKERERQRLIQEAQQEVACIISAASLGNFSLRMEEAGKQGFFESLARDLNRLSATTEQSLSEVADILRAVSGGDLSRDIPVTAEGVFGQLQADTHQTVVQLREVVGRIKNAADAIYTAAREIAAGNTDLSSRTEEQASSLEETSSSMEELNATVRQNAENAAEASRLAEVSDGLAVQAGEQVGSVVATMNDIETSSRKIADIIGVIDSIAFQTNILALNAAVEAARAGEQGRGFAVVATEVRNLAQHSANAAKEIKALIANSVAAVRSGAAQVEQAGQTVTSVVESFKHVSALVREISVACREQASGIDQITLAVSQMDEVTQQNAALVEQAAAAAESLEDQANELVHAVQGFRLHNLPARR